MSSFEALLVFTDWLSESQLPCALSRGILTWRVAGAARVASRRLLSSRAWLQCEQRLAAMRVVLSSSAWLQCDVSRSWGVIWPQLFPGETNILRNTHVYVRITIPKCLHHCSCQILFFARAVVQAPERKVGFVDLSGARRPLHTSTYPLATNHCPTSHSPTPPPRQSRNKTTPSCFDSTSSAKQKQYFHVLCCDVGVPYWQDLQ